MQRCDSSKPTAYNKSPSRPVCFWCSSSGEDCNIPLQKHSDDRKATNDGHRAEVGSPELEVVCSLGGSDSRTHQIEIVIMRQTARRSQLPQLQSKWSRLGDVTNLTKLARLPGSS